MFPDASLARNAINSAVSSPVAKRLVGLRRASTSLCRTLIPAVKSLTVNPGDTMLTVIPLGPNSVASDLVMPHNACFAER